MGDLGLLRKPPRGWLPGTVASVDHGYASHTDPGSGAATLETSHHLRVTWQVRLPGREPYLVDDERSCPVWVAPHEAGGQGKRWYSVKLRKSHGLLKGVEIPCFVDPADPGAIWVDWDAGYTVHENAWRHKSAVDRARAERSNPVDRIVNRVTDPFADKLGPEDQEAVDAQLAAEKVEQEQQWAAARKATEAATWAGVDPAEKAAFDTFAAELNRIDAVGRRCEGVLVELTDTGRIMVGLPVRRMFIRIADPETRVVAVELPLHQRMAKRYKPGTPVVVKVDPEDPEKAVVTRD